MLRALGRRCHHKPLWEWARRSQSDAAGVTKEQAAAALGALRSEPGPSEIFDRGIKRAQRDRAAWLLDPEDPLQVSVTQRLVERIDDCVRTFPTAVVVGGAGFPTIQALVRSRAGVKTLIYMDLSADMLQRVKGLVDQEVASGSGAEWPEMQYVQADEELLPLDRHSVDLVISSIGMHWVNDLPGAMTQCRMALRPDGLFVASMFGGDTLQELRIACSLAQQEQEGGLSPFVSPLAQVRDAGSLLTRAGLALPSVDVDSFIMRYPSPLDLVRHLRAMGESNALKGRRRPLQRRTALAAAEKYVTMFSSPDGGVPATFQVMYMTGWAPDAAQPKAARRGSATVSFEDMAKVVAEQTAKAATEEGGSTPGS